jgi:hypothetical protein
LTFAKNYTQHILKMREYLGFGGAVFMALAWQ